MSTESETGINMPTSSPVEKAALTPAHYTPEPPIADTPKTKQARGTSGSLG